MESYDVIVIGAGLAGLQAARLLAGHGLSVLLADRKLSLEQSVHTTGIFVRRSLEDFSLPPACLGAPIRQVTLYSPGRRKLVLESPREEFRIGRMAALYARLLKDCQAAGAKWLPGASYFGCEADAFGSLVRLEVGGRERAIRARFVIGSDGAASRVARDLGLSVNQQWIVGLEEVYEDVRPQGPPQLHCFLDRRLAPGYVAWIAADTDSVHVGVGGYREKFQPSAALDAFRGTIREIVDLRPARLVERRGGRIPVGGVLPRLACPRGLLIGDAAGAVSPLTAGGLDPCLRLTELAAKVTHRFLTSGDAGQLAAYDGTRFRRQFLARRALRAVYRLAGHNLLLEACCAVLRSGPGRRLAEHIFFSRGSFPDVHDVDSATGAESALRGNAQQRKAVAVN
ncbi:MAG: NAD(P)/FAD-dependent oxidoreductase [Pirellulales bacterium]